MRVATANCVKLLAVLGVGIAIHDFFEALLIEELLICLNAHIYALNWRKDLHQTEIIRIRNYYVLSNAIILCNKCQRDFDRELLCI